MNKREKKQTWLDLTDMLAWRGSYTGIQRVTYEYAKRFSDDGAKFFAYDSIGTRFIEIPFSLIESLKVGNPSARTVVDHVAIRRRIRHIVGKPYYLLPPPAKKMLNPVVKITNRTVRSALHSVLGGHTPRSPYGDYHDVIFENSDQVVLLGAGWNESTVLEKLAVIKEQTAIKIVQHVNDILPIYQPQLFADELPQVFRPYIDLVIHTADKISVISKATQRDIEIYCKENSTPVPKIQFVQLGDDPQSLKPTRPETIMADEQFILAVGTFEVRKNYTLLYQTIKLAQLENREIPKIVIVGRKGWLSDDIAHILKHDPLAKERIIWLDSVGDEQLEWLYKNCLFTIFPSLGEGWGLPIVESLQHGKFCLVSGVSSMLEIGNGLVDYFLPYDARECLEKINYYLVDQRYEAANEKVKLNYKPYTWDKSYGELKKFVG